MKINNIIDDNYKYKIIDKMEFDNKYLLRNTDGSKYKKYLLICYKNDDIIKYDDIPNESYLNRFSNIIKTYLVEEIVSICIHFDSMYKELNYFHIDDIYFIKYLIDEECSDMFKSNNDYEIIIDKLGFKLRYKEVNFMIKSKGWNWKIVKESNEEIWKNPSIESYYLLNRWLSQGKKSFLDLGCGLGRHSILFGKNSFDVFCFDISEEAINRTKKWAIKENLNFDYQIGDMLNLPYEDEKFDCILCRNVISHTDTEGMKKVVKELYRVLKIGGECYLTLGSKDTWGFKQENWPLLDENTRLRMEHGPEYKVPHFYVDYDLVKQLFSSFDIINIYQVIDYFEKTDGLVDSYHYHVLIKKNK